MNLEFLHNFISLVDIMNFTRTADYLHISQSTLSKQVSVLEKELGVALIIRTPRYIEVTAAGRFLYENGKHLLSYVEDIQNHIRAFEDMETGSITVSSITVDYPAVFRTIQRFHAAFPHAVIYLGHDLLLSTIRNVYIGKADFGITANYVLQNEASQYMGTMNTLYLKREPFYLLISQDWDDTDWKPGDLCGLPENTVFLIEDNLRNYLLAKEVCIPPLQRMRLKPMGRDYGAWSSMILQVQSGFCAAIAPRPMYHEGCKLFPIQNPGFDYNILAFWKKDIINPLIPQFVECLRAEILAEQA